MISTVRAMLANDIPAISLIESSVHRAPWSDFVLSECVRIGYDCRLLELEIEGHKEIIGYIISIYKARDCHVLNLCIAKAHQGKGYGKHLIKTLLNAFQKNDIATVSLEVRPSNVAALKLYHGLGFEKAGLKRNYYPGGDASEDAIILRKNL